MDLSKTPEAFGASPSVGTQRGLTLTSVSKQIGKMISNQTADSVGELADIVVRWDGQDPHPLVTGLVAITGAKSIFIPITKVITFSPESPVIKVEAGKFKSWERLSGELLLHGDFIGRQVVDTDDVRVLRARDLFLTSLVGQLRLVAVTGKKKFRLPEAGEDQERDGDLVDWADIHPFGDPGSELRLKVPHQGLRRLRPSELADILEQLDKEARDELTSTMDPAFVADAIEEMEPDEVEELLVDTDPVKAAVLISKMEPDEAVDALRDLGRAEADEIISNLSPVLAAQIKALLEYPEVMAGGFMTTTLVKVGMDDLVKDVIEKLKLYSEHSVDIDAVAIIDSDGVLVDDVGLFDLIVVSPDTPIRDLLHESDPVMVVAEDLIREVVQKLKDSRRSSVVVVDDQMCPIGRVLADDIIDALEGGSGFRFKMPWAR